MREFRRRVGEVDKSVSECSEKVSELSVDLYGHEVGIAELSEVVGKLKTCVDWRGK